MTHVDRPRLARAAQAGELRLVVDPRCAWCDLALARIEPLALRLGLALRVWPVRASDLWAAVGVPNDPWAHGEHPRSRARRADLQRMAAWWGVPVHERPAALVDAVDPCVDRWLWSTPDRARLGLLRALAVRPVALAEPDTVAALARAHGATALVDEGVVTHAVQAAAAAGVFGVPSLWTHDAIEFGVDRFDRFERARGSTPPPVAGTSSPPTRVEVLHDVASPFSYLGVVATGGIGGIGRTGAERVALSFSPILLGALFRDVGTADVPLFTMGEMRRRWVAEDLRRAAADLGVPFRFPARFPLRSVLPSRVMLVEPAAMLPIYRAAWAENRCVDEPEALTAVLAEAGLPGAALVAAAERPDIKQALRDNTDRARAAGAFGVPTFVLDGEAGTELVWGQDRLDYVRSRVGR